MAEKAPLLGEDLTAAYGTDSHATYVKPPQGGTATQEECLVDYEPLKLSSFRVFFLSKGTIIKNPVLHAEQFLISFIFVACAVPVYIYFKSEVDSENKGDAISLRKFIREQEGKMRAFAMIMTGLAAFLLSFYTSIIVSRWWTMRTAGVGAIKAATVDLELLLYQCVTQEERVLSAVRRYGRTSLLLIFLWRRQEMANVKQILMGHGLLDEHECDQLLKWNKHVLHETIWAWQTGIITKLHRQGQIKSDQLYAMLLEKCTDGRAAAQCIHTHLAVRVPMQYVHLLGLLVKMHNFILAVIMGLLFGAAIRNGHYVLCVQLFGRTLILPFLFNAILLINCDLSDPFESGEADFPGEVYQAGLEKDCVGIISATQNMPAWLQEGRTDKMV